jgi:hypothetical protein
MKLVGLVISFLIIQILLSCILFYLITIILSPIAFMLGAIILIPIGFILDIIFPLKNEEGISTLKKLSGVKLVNISRRTKPMKTP